jgi:hypothetical protein
MFTDAKSVFPSVRHPCLSVARKNLRKSAPSADIKTEMSGVPVLVGTRKGAFILTPDAKRKDWKVGTYPLISARFCNAEWI